MRMTWKEKATEYRRIAESMADYIWDCSDKGIIPMKHDANVYITRINQVKFSKNMGDLL